VLSGSASDPADSADLAGGSEGTVGSDGAACAVPRRPTLAEAPARLLGSVPWLFCLALAAVGVAGVTPLAWIGAGLVAGLSLSGSI
jgi:hypothetical protein